MQLPFSAIGEPRLSAQFRCADSYHQHPMLEQQIQQHFIDSADLKYQAAQALSVPISSAVQALLACITGGGKILACGAGVSAGQAQMFASLCVSGFERERPELAALALTADSGFLTGLSSSYGLSNGYLAQQVRALGQANDVLLVISITGQDGCILEAVEAAHERDMMVIALSGATGGAIASRMQETDTLICVPHERAARVREMHDVILNCLCDGIDTQLLGEQEMK